MVDEVEVMEGEEVGVAAIAKRAGNLDQWMNGEPIEAVQLYSIS
jgi:hypothetical protein